MELTEIIPYLLSLRGIRGLSVKFDSAAEQVHINYENKEGPHQQMISFKEIEQLFTMPIQAPAGPEAGDL